MYHAPKASANIRKGNWKQDPDAVKADILRVATEEFATHGLSGGRIDAIAKRTTVSKRMIYYYFGNKEGLYQKRARGCVRSPARKRRNTNGPKYGTSGGLGVAYNGHLGCVCCEPLFIRLIAIANIHNVE